MVTQKRCTMTSIKTVKEKLHNLLRIIVTIDVKCIENTQFLVKLRVKGLAAFIKSIKVRRG